MKKLDEMNDVEKLEFYQNKLVETETKLNDFLSKTKRRKPNIFVLSSRQMIKRCERIIEELKQGM